ncbi:hypothetical protein G352_26512 [Rhodococcus ruber BKS 20-38]|uniref:Uncharacterized protein n=1 Tax=Rhodococcus ruber BKS 20-38 TaxID=1278076 RepID=M2YRW8_9NOCA|nr:hypothetical protein G352_26512 [Rhodococcus ruber BKS 20-38]
MRVDEQEYRRDTCVQGGAVVVEAAADQLEAPLVVHGWLRSGAAVMEFDSGGRCLFRTAQTTKVRAWTPLFKQRGTT